MSDLAALDRAGAPVPEYKRAGTLIHVFAGIAAFALIGMLADIWQMVLLAVPLFALAMMLMGSLRANGTWDRASSIGIVAYCAVLAVLVVWSVIAEAGDATLWGLPMSMGVIVYFVWPYTAIGAGLLYAFVFDRTIDEKRTVARAA